MNNNAAIPNLTSIRQGLNWCLTDEDLRVLAASDTLRTTVPDIVGRHLHDIPGFPAKEQILGPDNHGFRHEFEATPHPFHPMIFAATPIASPGQPILYHIAQNLPLTAPDPAYLKSILSGVKSGIFLLDMEGRLLLANDEGNKLLELYSVDDYENGTPYFIDLLPEYRRDAFRQMLTESFGGVTQEYEARYHTPASGDVWLLINLIPQRDPQGRINGICITTYDITRRKLEEQAFIRNEERWKFAVDGTGDGLWEFNFQTDEIYYSANYKKMLGYEDYEFANTITEWKTRIHPADLHLIDELDEQYVNGTITSHAIEYRIMNRANEYIWILDRGMLVDRTPDGKPGRIIGTHKNITQRKHAEQQLREFSHLFSSFMSNTPNMTWIVDEYQNFRFINDGFKKAFQVTENTIGLSIYDIFPKEIADEFVKNNQIVWDTNQSIEVFEKGIGPDGKDQWYHVVKFPLEAENGIRLLGGVALDITHKRELEQQLAKEEEQKKREIIQAIMSAQEEERRDLAYELHDNVNQILTSAKLMLEVSMEKVDAAQPFVKRSLDYLQEAIREIRKLSHKLTPGTLRDISLDAALDELVQNLNGSEKLTIQFRRQVAVEEIKLKPEIQMSFLRIAQEQLSNILNHSGATEATITLIATPVKTALAIRDNGCGFNPDTVKRGLGLNNIYNRVEYYKGRVEIVSSPGAGSSLLVEIPTPADDPA